MPTAPLARVLRLSSVLVIALSSLCFSWNSASAAETADEADLQFQLGNDRYDAGDIKSALEHFLASNRLAPNKNVLFDIARCYEQLKLLPDAYRYYSASLEAETNETGKRRTQESLDRLKPRVALLTIESDPPGATIYLDRKDLGSRGTTPRSLALPEGTHTVLAELPDYELAQSEKLELRLGEETHSVIKLKPILGTLRIRGTKQASVRLDSQPKTLCSVPCAVDVQVGRHVLSVSRDGFRTQELPVEVTAHEVTLLRATLEPLSGTAVVNADVRDALITVDGRPRAFTPAVVSLPVGKHEIVISPAGYRPLRRTVMIETDKSTPVDFEMSGQEEVLGASRASEAVEDAPASVTIISRQELKAMAYPTIAEAIRGVRGIYLSNDDTYVSTGVRGFSRPGDYGNRILVLLDGHPTNDDWVGSSYVGFDARVDLDDVERIEVIRGAGSVIYGNGAFFGVINLVTRPKDEPTHVELGVSTALGAGRARASAVWHASNDAGVWLSLSGAKSPGVDRFYPEYVSTPANPLTDFRGNPTTGTVSGADGFEAATLGGRAWYQALSAEWFLTSHDKHSPSAQYLTLFGDPAANNHDTRGFVDLQLEPKSESVESLTRVSNAPILVVGAETELRHEWQQGWMLSASASVQKASYQNDKNRRNVPNSPLVLGAAKAMMPLIGRTLKLASRLSVEGPRYDNAIFNKDVTCDPNAAVAVACPAQGNTTTGVVWDLVLTGAIERFDANYAVGLYNLMDWQYDTVPSTEYAQRTIRQRPRSALASLSLKF